MKMVKKKQAKDKRTGVSGFTHELVGLFVFINMILLLGNLGLIGRFLRRMAVIMFGDFFWGFALIVVAFSFKLIVSRSKPSFFEYKYVGSYLVLTGVVIIAHTPVWREFVMRDLSFTQGIGQFYLAADVVAEGALVGGGLFGAVIWGVLADLVDSLAMWFIAMLIISYGCLLLVGLSLQDLYNLRRVGWLKEKIKRIWKLVRNTEVKSTGTKGNPIIKKLPVKEKVTPQKVTKTKKKKNTASIPIVSNDGPSVHDFTENLADILASNSRMSVADQDYVLPPNSLLVDHVAPVGNVNSAEIAKAEAARMDDTFANFDVRATVTKVHIGPTVTQFEVTPQAGVKVNKITGLADDIALALAVSAVRIEAPIPGKSAVGIEVPNKEAQVVSFKEIMGELMVDSKLGELKIVLGRNITGASIFASLNKMPHLLVAGATGSGKSVCINTMICSLLMQFSPQYVRLLLVDPKKVELVRYNGLPHLLAPVVTDPQLASAALKKVVAEMDRRYDLFSEAIVRDVESYNKWVVKERIKRKNEGVVSTLLELPFIVVIIDELADLMMVASREVEDSIMRLTQMARAAGIHLVVATQRPSVDVITGVIKSNIPSRIAFGVSSGTDSRTILDAVGAEKLLGRGDMLFSPMGAPAPVRVQGAFIADEEVARIVEFIKGQKHNSEISADFLANIDVEQDSKAGLPSTDSLIRDVLAFAFENQKISTSMLQRRFRIGYNRAARLVEELEEAGLVGSPEGSKGRPVLIDEDEYRKLIS